VDETLIDETQALKQSHKELDKELETKKQVISKYIDLATQKLDFFSETIPSNDLAWMISMAKQYNNQNDCNIVLFGEDVGVAVTNSGTAKNQLMGCYEEVKGGKDFCKGLNGKTKIGRKQQPSINHEEVIMNGSSIDAKISAVKVKCFEEARELIN